MAAYYIMEDVIKIFNKTNNLEGLHLKLREEFVEDDELIHYLP
jgi:hypothetical protein